MKHDHRSFAAAASYRQDPADRIRRFLPMVRRLAWHVHGSGRAGLELDDLMQTGLVALTEAAQRHAGPGEDGFAAYAKLRVRGAMLDLVRRSIPRARSLTEQRRALANAEELLRGRLGRDATSAEVAAELGISATDLADWRTRSAPVHLEPLDEAYNEADMAFADEGADTFSVLADAETREHLVAAITALPERLQLVIQLYFVEELNLAEIAAALRVSVPRVHQLKAQALEKLREGLAGVADIA